MTAAPLRLDVTATGGPAGALDLAVEAERRGFDRLVMSETSYNPFLQLARAADRTESIELATGVAIAFARTPMSLAYEAWGLHEASGGRAVIGLGSQVKPHIVRRFGMEWSRPAARMREYIAAVRAIWHSWQTGERLAFRGEFYSHTLMTPVFAPDPNPQGTPPILLAGVGPLMTEAAGAVADGFISHPFTSIEYLTGTVLPRVRAARAKSEAEEASWTSRPFEVVGNVLRHRPYRGGAGRQPAPCTGAGRLLRVHPRLPGCPGDPRLGSTPRRAAHLVGPRPLAGDGRADRRRGLRHFRGGR